MKMHTLFLLVVFLTFAVSGCGPGPGTAPTATSAAPTPTSVPPMPTPVSPAQTPVSPAQTPVPPAQTPTPSVKRVVLIIAHENFADPEYTEPRAVFEAAGFEITVASSSLETATGGQGTQVQPDILVSDVAVGDYDAFVFVGGMGCMEYWDNPDAHRIAQDAVAEGKVLAAICAAPVILARAGMLEGKQATVANSGWQEGVSELEAGGATYTGAAVERDGLIVTGNGPSASRQFGETIVTVLEE